MEIENEMPTSNHSFLEKIKTRDFRVEIALIFILGVFLGISIKTEAVKKITIGFYDYKLKFATQAYDISAIEREIMEEVNQQQDISDVPAGENEIEN